MEPEAGLKLTDTNEEGVDLTLIRWFLTLAPAERSSTSKTTSGELCSFVTPSQRPKLIEILSTLGEEGVEYVLVGGLSAVAQGAPVVTFDADIVHLRKRRMSSAS